VLRACVTLACLRPEDSGIDRATMRETASLRDQLGAKDNKNKDGSKKKDERSEERNWTAKQLRESAMGRSRGKDTGR